ncbi:phosphotransferase family protein [Deinococcus apachensis]|uniref:phosphotransferase family protein n=1 Tax=Deinococcus apachensis TaxID=309886 RepID=UPI00036280AE|nr:phosphotransferase [Deinococcus apachensis]
MSNLPDLTPAELDTLARKHGLRGPLTRLPSTGIVNRAYANAEVVLRVAVPGDEMGVDDARTEAVAVPAVLRAGVPTPALLAFDDDRDVVDAPVTVYARIPAPNLHGVGWDVADPRFVRAARETGRALAQLHLSVTEVPDPHGWLEVWDVPDAREEVEAAASAGRVDRLSADWAIRLLTRTVALPRPTPRFLHGDVQPGNLLVNPDGSLAALIDWGDAGWADPAFDFPALPPQAAAHAVSAYRDVAPELLGEDVEGRILEVYLNMAFRRLGRAPTHRELWNARPGSVLAHLLRFAVDAAPEWREWLRGE